MIKRCTNPKCKNPLKLESEFYTDRTKSDGLQHRCIECVKEYKQKRKHFLENQRLIREYNFFPNELEIRLKEQDYKCLICYQIMNPPCVDHCHRTNKNRGLLCKHCNIVLGWFENHFIQEYLNKPDYEFLLVWLSPRNKKDSHLRNDHNICLDDFEMMLKSQNGVCWICHKICATGNNLCVDHNWQTLRVRGLLCVNCNSNLGWFENNPVQEYLEEIT